jgi:ribosomal-protein-alanine N-acetyltransferase
MDVVFPELHTPRLRLRALTPADAPALLRIHADTDWMRWYGIDPVRDLSEAEQLAELFAGWFASGAGFRWGLEKKDDGALIGSCGLFRWNRSWRNCALSYEIARDCRRRGYMREALSAVLDYGFDFMQLHRIQAETHPDNAASIALATRLGFRFEGVHREQGYWNGRFHDLHCYALLEQDWRHVKRST